MWNIFVLHLCKPFFRVTRECMLLTTRKCKRYRQNTLLYRHLPLLSAMRIPRLSRQNILTDLDESLRCLQRETIDLYWLHRDDQNDQLPIFSKH